MINAKTLNESLDRAENALNIYESIKMRKIEPEDMEAFAGVMKSGMVNDNVSIDSSFGAMKYAAIYSDKHKVTIYMTNGKENKSKRFVYKLVRDEKAKDIVSKMTLPLSKKQLDEVGFTSF